MWCSLFRKKKSWSGAYTCCGPTSVLMTQADAWWLTKAQLHRALKRCVECSLLGFHSAQGSDGIWQSSALADCPNCVWFGSVWPRQQSSREAGQEGLGLLQPSTPCPDLPISGMSLMCSNCTPGTRRCTTGLTSHLWGTSDALRGVRALWVSSSRNSSHKQ